MCLSNRPILRLTFSFLVCFGLVTAPGLADDRWSRLERPRAEKLATGEGPAFELARSPMFQRLLAEAEATAVRPGLPPRKGVAIDPLGDTFGSGSPQIDIIGLTADVVQDVPVIFIFFSAPISPGDSGAANAVVGFIDIDADQDGTTGDIPFIDIANPAGAVSGMGNEFYVDLFSYSSADGGADVVDDVTDVVVGRTPVFFGTNALAVVVLPPLIGSDDGAVDVATVIGTIPEPTDVAPNVGSVPSDTSTLLQGVRFRTSIDWRRPPNFPDFRPARVSDFRTGDSANFYFRNPNNLEFLIKVLDGCNNNGHFWVFFAGATDVEFVVTVEDTVSGEFEQYINPLGQPANAVTDTQAFATCP